jgi:hypothetical protein
LAREIGSDLELLRQATQLGHLRVVKLCSWWNRDAAVLAEVSEGLGEAMIAINCGSMAPGEKMAGRGWQSHVVMTLHGQAQAGGRA